MFRQDGFGAGDLAIVTEDQVVALASIDLVAIVDVSHHNACYIAVDTDNHIYDDFAVFTADDDVISIPGKDCVIATMIRLGAKDAVDVIRRYVVSWQFTSFEGSRSIDTFCLSRGPVDVAAVTDDNVVGIGTIVGGIVVSQIQDMILETISGLRVK